MSAARERGGRRRPAIAALAIAAAVAAAGCATTRITSTWRDPAVGPVQFRKVVGVALTSDTTLRRIAEDEFVRAVGPDVAIAGYGVLPDDEMRDREQAKQRIQSTGADGAVVYRLAGVETRERWVPPTTYGNAWGYWGWAAPIVYQPGYLTTDRYVQIETAVYDVASARLVWAARSETLNPKDAHDVAAEVVRASVAAMREAKLLPPQ